MKTTMFVAVALCAFAGSAMGADEVFPRRFAPNQFDQVVELVEGKMADGGSNAATEAERAEVRKLLGEIGGLVEGHGRLSELDANARAGVDERRKQINTLLADNAQAVAEEDAKPGSKGRRKAYDMIDSRPASPNN
jgi:hypothetical protein